MQLNYGNRGVCIAYGLNINYKMMTYEVCTNKDSRVVTSMRISDGFISIW